MNRFEWDGLRPGDVVHVHDAGEPGSARRGTVVFLTVRVRQPNLAVRARDSYVRSSPASPSQ